MKYALKLVPGLVDGRVLQGVGGGPRTIPPNVWKVVRKKGQVINFTMHNNISSMKYTQKSVPGLADVGVPRGDGNGGGPLSPS